MTVSIDWKDVRNHNIAGACVGVIAPFLPLAPWPPEYLAFLAWFYLAPDTLLVVSNLLFWHGREWVQRIRKGQPYSHVWTSTQVILEWTLPAVICALVWYPVKLLLAVFYV